MLWPGTVLHIHSLDRLKKTVQTSFFDRQRRLDINNAIRRVEHEEITFLLKRETIEQDKTIININEELDLQEKQMVVQECDKEILTQKFIK
ncbi:hypothetical protein CWI38_0349p0040 [Hamiltosporidium tvaerminnensis]|uniref:Uncharacterized protein n=1 Tax=Hamiltosporidium tvaerminnensis TaxID=1176355 RepID=A0A4Q9LYA0_9MICR|nr:hypothetical protein CWI38_0349p0040 [Hamiltosporidium tvaerminnensis]